MKVFIRKILVLLRNTRKSVLDTFFLVLPPWISWVLSVFADRQFYLSALAARYSALPLLNKYIFYEAYNGRDFAGNPYALFIYLLSHPDYRSYIHVIVSSDPDHPKSVKFKNHPSVIIVKPDSEEYVKYAESCRYFINNSSWRPYLIKRVGQIYIYTWHSTLLKKLASDKGAVWESKNVSRALLCADYFISPNRFTTDLLLESHCAGSLVTARIAEFGYPRNDLTFNSDKVSVRKNLMVPDGKKLLIYAPTWRGEYAPVNNIKETMNSYHQLSESLDENWHVVIKFHTMVYRFLDRKTLEFCPPQWMDTNELLAASDLLVTDYSGIFYDYLITGNPVVFFTPDLDSYAKAKKGFYIDPESLPGPITRSIEETIAFIENSESIKETYSEKYLGFRNKYTSEDDGRACERSADLVFKGYDDKRVYSRKDKRKKILIYIGGLEERETVESLLSFINSADYNFLNISVLLNNSFVNRDIQHDIAGKAGIFYSEAYDSFTYKEYIQASKCCRKEILIPDDIPVEAYRRSIKRVFGNTVFDMAINWNMYDMPSAMRSLFGTQAAKRVIYLDKNFISKIEKKERKFYKLLTLILYYDRIICPDKYSIEKIVYYFKKESGFNPAEKKTIPVINIFEEILNE